MVVASGTAEDITVSNELSADFTAANVRYNDAVVVPQVVAGSTAFIRVTLPDNRVLEWSPETAFTLESGKQYTYHVTLTRTGLNVTLSVTRWEDEMSNYLSWLERMMRLVCKTSRRVFFYGSKRCGHAGTPGNTEQGVLYEQV